MNNVGLELGWNSARGIPLVAENGTHTRFLGDGSLIPENELLGVIEELGGNVLEATTSFEIQVDTSGLVDSGISAPPIYFDILVYHMEIC